MRSVDLEKLVINHSVQNSGHVDRRGYIGLSQMGDCDLVIYNRFRNGDPAGVSERMKHRISFDIEREIILRLREIGVYHPGSEIVLHNGLFRGHTDGFVDIDLLEIKSIEQEAWIPEPGRLPNRVFYQVQAYLHFLGVRYGHVLYLARNTGALRVIGVSRNQIFGERIEEKIERLAQAVKDYQKPACTCGKCHV